jgi:hypothetical protein
MKAYSYSIAAVNVTLFALFWWMCWMGDTHLPAQLDSQMSGDVMRQKYQTVCTDLTASMASMCLLAIVLVNVALICTYFSLKENLSSAACSNLPPEETC